MNQHKTVMPEAMKACIFARKDFFRLLDCMRSFLEEPVERSVQKQRVDKLVNAIHTSANAGMNEYMLSDDYREFPAYFAEGQEANWLWLDSKLYPYKQLPHAEAVKRILECCTRLQETCRYGTPGSAKHAHEILVCMEKRYGYLSRVISRCGLHMLAFTTLESDFDYFDMDVKWKWTGGIFSTGIVFASLSPQMETTFDYLIFESVTATIMNQIHAEAVLEESGLQMLEAHWDSEIRTRRPEDQIGAFYDAVLMGLAYKAPYGDFAGFQRFDDSDREAWSMYARQLIRRAGGEVLV